MPTTFVVLVDEDAARRMELGLLGLEGGALGGNIRTVLLAGKVFLKGDVVTVAERQIEPMPAFCFFPLRSRAWSP